MLSLGTPSAYSLSLSLISKPAGAYSRGFIRVALPQTLLSMHGANGNHLKDGCIVIQRNL